MFLDDLKAYLVANGFADIYRDTLPDEPDECIGLFVWAHTVPSVSDGSAWRYVSVQVRRQNGDDAYAAAFAIFQLLDSGLDETPIALAEGRECIARPRSGPKKLSVDESGRTIYYTEIALWGENEP